MGERDRGRGSCEWDAIELNLACQRRINIAVSLSLCLAAALYATFAFVWFYVLPLPLCVRVTMCTQHESKGMWELGGGGVQPAYRCLPFNFYCFWRPAPRQAATNSYAIFVFIFHMQPHTQPPGPGPDLVTAPGLHTRTRAETHKHTHTCRENESQVSWLFTLRFLRYS